MANNRMYLRCRTCGNAIMLGKSWGGGYALFIMNGQSFEPKTKLEIDNLKVKKIDELDDFLGKHEFCEEVFNDSDDLEPKFIPKKVDVENNFEIAYEFFRS